MKVYLSRSNGASSAVVNIVHQELKRFGHEVVMWDGTTPYDNKPLLACEALVLVPHNDTLPTPDEWEGDGNYNDDDQMITGSNDDAPNVGLGQFNQISDFVKEHAKYKRVSDGSLRQIITDVPILMVTNVSVNSTNEQYIIGVGKVTTLEYMGDDRKTEWAYTTLDEDNSEEDERFLHNMLPDHSAKMTPGTDGCNYRPEGFTLTEGPMLAAAKLFGIL